MLGKETAREEGRTLVRDGDLEEEKKGLGM